MNDAPHLPVMLREVMEQLAPRPGEIVVDATTGFGGHAMAMAKAAGERGFLLGLDRDPAALSFARDRLGGTGTPFQLVQAPFSRLRQTLEEHAPGPPQVILWDLGVSSPQLDRGERGFSFLHDGPLDMRMDPDQDTTAADLVNTLSLSELQQIFSELGEERFSGRIARQIVARRPLTTTRQLADLVAHAVPGGARGRIHPATRVFQALRIAVNRELEELEAGLAQGLEMLAQDGRLGVLAYHSLEDRIVKRLFREAVREGRHGGGPGFQLLTRRPLRPGEEEITSNPRSRSARLRAIRKVDSPSRTWRDEHEQA